MSDNYILFTDSGADIPPSLLSEWGVGYQPLTFRFDHIDKEFSNDEMDIREFYRLMREGHIAKTSAVASAIFKDTFEAILAEGKDILYLAFSSGLSATCNNGRVAAADGDEGAGIARIEGEIRRGEDFGLLGCLIVVALFVALMLRGMRIAMRCPDKFGTLLAAGITSSISVQAFLNMGVVVGILPTTGLPLPFFSAGGTSISITMAAIGILLNISRESAI